MSQPVAIPRNLHISVPLNGTSPGGLGSPSWSGVGGPYGASPPSSRTASIDKQTPYAAAKKFWKRLKYDPSMDPEEYTIGLVETVQHPERKSGAEAWSMRQHNRLVELSYFDFVDRFKDQDIPFHRIVYFKHGDCLVWESDFQRRQAQAGHFEGLPPLPPGPSSGYSSPLFGTSPNPISPWISSSTSPLFFNVGGAQENQEVVTRDSSLSGSVDDGDGEVVEEQRAYDQLPDECWMTVLRELAVKELCMVGKVNRVLRELIGSEEIWGGAYQSIFGTEAPEEWTLPTLRRMCRRSELRAARWLEADVQQQKCGFANTACLHMDDSKVVTGDGSAVRLWSHTTGRRLATLQGHTGRVTCATFDDQYVLSGCSQGVVKLWHMDDLKCTKTLRHHTSEVSDCTLVHGLPVTAGKDASICLWDVSQSQPIMVLDAQTPVFALEGHEQNGYLISAGWHVDIWDMNTAQKLHTLTEDHLTSSDHPFTCVTYSGPLLAGGSSGHVVVWDPRSQDKVATLTSCTRAPLSEDKDSPCGQGEEVGCVGVQMDDWKLMTGFNDGSHTLLVHDIRTLSSSSNSSWLEPVLTLSAGAKVQCFQYHKEHLLVARESKECLMFSFCPPGCTTVPVVGTDTPSSSSNICTSDIGGTGLDKGGRRKKPAKLVKKQTRYPKRTTR